MANQVCTTLREMGLRSAKSVANHLLQENTYESNLVPDIAQAPYLHGAETRTHLAPLSGFPPFCDDIYVYGRLAEADIVRVGQRVSCTTGADGSASRVVGLVSNHAKTVWPAATHKYIHVSIANTVDIGANSKIPQTIFQIELHSAGSLEEVWRTLHADNPVAYFVAKLDVSELPIEVLHAGLSQFQGRLRATGMGLYQIDYTQDFSGTLDRIELVRYLVETHNFYNQAEPHTAQGERTGGCILDNTASVGNHVCTFVRKIGGPTVSSKAYNKYIAQIEAGDVRGQFGGHMSGLVASTNEHLRTTLAHPDAIARGCTRWEISIYGSEVEELSPSLANKMLQQVWEMATPEGEEDQVGLFVVQPLAKLWENYANCLDRCLVLADRPHSSIYVAWSGSSKTGRTQGVLVRPTKTNVERDTAWRRAIGWAMSNFALRRCPIFLAEILAIADEEVQTAPLRCYTKDAPTILCASTRPCQLRPPFAPTNLAELLPPTNTIEWAWREQKSQRIGIAQPSCELLEVPTMVDGKQLSTLSTRGRADRLAELVEAASRHKRAKGMQKFFQREAERIAAKREEFEKLAEATNFARKEKERQFLLHCEIARNIRSLCVEKVSNYAGREAFVLAYTQATVGNTKKVVLDIQPEVGDLAPSPEDFGPRVVWATKGLERILEAHKTNFEVDEKFENWCSLYWLPFRETKKRKGLRIHIQPSKSFWNNMGKQIHWNPLALLSSPNSKKLAEMLAFLRKEETKDLLEQMEAKRVEVDREVWSLRKSVAPRQCEATSAMDMLEGTYAVLGYAETTFRKVRRTNLFLAPLDGEGRHDPLLQKPVRGLLLQEEIERLGPLAELEGKQLLCHLGAPKTTKTKKTCRRAQIVVSETILPPLPKPVREVGQKLEPPVLPQPDLPPQDLLPPKPEPVFPPKPAGASGNSQKAKKLYLDWISECCRIDKQRISEWEEQCRQLREQHRQQQQQRLFEQQQHLFQD